MKGKKAAVGIEPTNKGFAGLYRRALPAGSFAFMKPEMRHFAWATGETVIQVHGMGPWKINHVNPADEPRNKK